MDSMIHEALRPNRGNTPAVTPLRLLPIMALMHAVTATWAQGDDTDLDGLRDEVETGTGTYLSPLNTGTDPLVADTDGDSMPDGMEVDAGTDPLDSSSTIRRPNIIFIIADDLGYGDVSCFWKKQRTTRGIENVVTPGLDQMAKEGAMLTDHYAAAPICASSRASFLLGQHQGHAEIRDRQFDKALPDAPNVASILKKAGYRTIHVGKAGLAGTLSKPLESSSHLPAHPLKRGFDRFFGYLRHNDGHEHYPRNGTAPRLAVIHDDYKPVLDAHVDLFTGDAWTAFAKKTITEQTQANPRQPFFLYLSYDTPHFYGQYPPSSQYPPGRGLNGGIRWTGAPSYTNTATNDSSRVDHPDNRHPSAQSNWKPALQKYISMVRRLDDSVADILQTLRDLQIDRNTLVVFTSDNGPAETETTAPFLQSYAGFEGVKTDLLEGGIRVPTIAWWPDRVPAGSGLAEIRRISLPSVNYDWLATFVELAGVVPPSSSDGTSLAPVLTGAADHLDREFIYFEFSYPGKTAAYPGFVTHPYAVKNQMQAIRAGRFKGLRYDVTGPDTPFRIYDLVSDPAESTDLSASRPDLAARMNYLSVAARRPGGGLTRPYDAAPIPAVNPPKTRNGIKWKSHEGHWTMLPDFRLLGAVRSGVAPAVSTSHRSRACDSGLSFEGYLRVPADGPYTFHTKSDSELCMWLHEARIIANNSTSANTVSSPAIHLAAGLHPLRIHYRHRSGPSFLQLSYSGPGIPLQEIPPAALFVDGDATVAQDSDGDGFTNGDELLAGTDMGDPSSFFHATSIESTAAGILLKWRAVAGRTYRIQEWLNHREWSDIPDLDAMVVRKTDAGRTVLIPHDSGSMRVFRIIVSITPADADADSDGDGSPDNEEIISGTDPGDAASRFRIANLVPSHDGMVLHWSAKAGRTYIIEESADMVTWTEAVVPQSMVFMKSVDQASCLLPTGDAAVRFMRMKVFLTP